MIKTKSKIEMKIDELLNTASVLEKMRGWVEPQDYFSVRDSEITFWPSSEIQSRRQVGGMIRAFAQKPKIEKSGTMLTAAIEFNGVTVKCYGYKTRKCAVIKKQIVHEAEPEKVIPAKSSWVEEVEELVCEMPGVQAEVDSTIAKIVEKTPVPF